MGWPLWSVKDRVVRAETRTSQRPWAAYTFALGAALCYGSSSVLAKNLITDYAPPLVIASFAHFFGGIIVLSFVARNLPSNLKTPKTYLGMMFLSGLCAAGAVIALYFGLSRAPVVVVAPIVSVTPLITLVLAHLFLQHMERITLRLIIGTLLVVGGVCLVILGNTAG